MANSYRRIANDGADVFYHGEIAEQIDAHMRANNALIGKQDLADYEAEITRPLWGTYRGLDMSTNRPPDGGVMLMEMLNMLECFDLKVMGHNSPEYIRTVAEVMKVEDLGQG